MLVDNFFISSNAHNRELQIMNNKLQYEKNDILVKVKYAQFGKALYRSFSKQNKALGSLISGIIENDNPYFKKGNSIIFDPHGSCGKCINCINNDIENCVKKEKYRLYPCGLSKNIVINSAASKYVYEINPENSLCALYTELVACALHSVKLSNIKKNNKILIVGSGQMALIHIQLIRFFYPNNNIYCMYKSEVKKQLIKRLGAKPIYINQKINSEFDIVFEVTGNHTNYKHVIKYCKNGGKIVFFGGCGKDKKAFIDINYIHYHNQTLIGSYHYNNSEFYDALKLIESKCIDINCIISHILKFEDIVDYKKIIINEDYTSIVVKMS